MRRVQARVLRAEQQQNQALVFSGENPPLFLLCPTRRPALLCRSNQTLAQCRQERGARGQGSSRGGTFEATQDFQGKGSV